MKNRNIQSRRFCSIKRNTGEKVVQNDLAITPRQMDQMMKDGIPISAQNLNADMFYDGDANPGFDIPLDMQRGIDIADCWDASVSIRKKAKKGLLRDKKQFDSTNVQKGGE